MRSAWRTPKSESRTPSNACRGQRWSARFLCALLLFLIAAPMQLVGEARDFPPEVAPPKPVVLAVPQVRQFANGLKVVVIERRSLPLVTLRLVVKSGAEVDPPGLAGTAQLVAGLLSQGTARRNAREIANAVDSAGGTLDTGADWDDSYISLTVLSDYTQLAFDLVADMASHPAFAQAEVERQRKQTLSALEVMYDDPSYLADTVFDRLIFAGTPYGHPADGTPETVKRISGETLRAFHARYYRPDNSILAAVGNVGSEGAYHLAEASFGDWRGAASNHAEAPVSSAPAPTERFVVIDKPDAVQTEIRAGNHAVRRASDDYYALTLANQVLGGPAANRLFKALRTQQGLTYGASSDLVCQDTAGSWMAKTSTRTAETIRSLGLVLEELKRLHDDHVTGIELRTAQSYLIGHLALQFETSEDIATQTLELMVHSLPLDYWNRFPQEIQALSSEDVSRATHRYLDPDESVLALVGNAGTFKKELKRFGSPLIIPLRDLDLASPDLRRATVARAP